MKALIYERFGPPEVLQLKEIDKPTPNDDEVLIRIHASQVTRYDCWMRNCTAPPGFGFLMKLASGKTPKIPILGTDLAGKVEAVGKNVTRFKQGDKVFGINAEGQGGYAEYICLSEDSSIATIPQNMSLEEAAGVPYGALTSLYFLRMANIQKGDKVLVFGASGGLGLFGVQLAKFFGAQVDGVCSTTKMELVKAMGADTVFDYTNDQYLRSNEKYDVIYDTIGKSPFSWTKKSLNTSGCYISATFGLPRLLQMAFLKITTRKKAKSGALVSRAEDLKFIKGLIEEGNLKVKIDKQFTMKQAVEAHRYVESGKKQGAVIINI